jgi:D-tyrosyl-tRNA(Tyr) deacylase
VRAVVQRVSGASVTVSGRIISRIDAGLVVLIGVSRDDGPADVSYTASKVHGLRVFADENGRLNRSASEIDGALLVVSQFTLYGDVRRGRRPSFIEAAEPPKARELYDAFVSELRALGSRVAEGVFQADMQVALVNDGPVTVLIDSRKLF